MRFEFATAARILFGPGTVAEIPAETAALGKKPLVVTGASGARRYASLIEALGRTGLAPAVFCVPGEPDTGLIEQGAAEARRAGCDLVIAIGGGSVLDAGKAIAALLTNPGELMDYLEVVGRARPLERPAAPCIAVPTTAGTGAEVTRNAVLTSKEHRVKVSMRSPSMLPRLAVVDPELALSVPADVTAATGLDALTQLIEAFTCNAPNPMTDGFCREGIQRAAQWLRRAFEAGDDLAARENMAVASLLSGLALANARLGAVHGFAGPIGGMFPAPHGAVCARLLPGVIEANCRALEMRAPDSPARTRYTELARLLTGRPDATAPDGAAWIRNLCTDLGVRPLSAFGIRPEDVPALVTQAGKASSMKGNPIALTETERTAILANAL
jgi:alcohol dehydrogenase class IV